MLQPWDPECLQGYRGPKMRTTRDLLDRVPLNAPLRIIDLGCGNGDGSRFLAQRYAEARILAVDVSPEAPARGTADGRITFVQADPARWSPQGRVDLLYSSSALDRLPDHEVLFPRLLTMLAPWGVLAVQMPRNHDEPAYRCIAEAVRAGPWRDTLEPLLRPIPVTSAVRYARLLSPRTQSLDLWETVYHPLLSGPDPVANWMKETSLKSFLDALGDDTLRESFYEDYRARVARAYPTDGAGHTLFPFRRLFLIAQGPLG